MSAKKNYKHQKTTSFNRGMGQYIIEDDKKFFLSENVRANENGKLTLARNFSSIFTSDVLPDAFAGLNSSCVSTPKASFIVLADEGYFKVYKSTNGTSFSLVDTFLSNDSDLPFLFVAFKGYLIITGYSGHYYYSTDEGDTWIQSTDENLPAVRSFCEHNNRLYLLTDNAIGYIEDPAEGFVLWHDSDDSVFAGFEYLADIFSVAGSLYFIHKEKVYLIEGENFSKVFSIKSFADILKFEEIIFFLFASENGLTIYTFDGISFSYLSYFPKINAPYLTVYLQTSEFAIIGMQISNIVYFYRIYKDGSVFLDYKKTYSNSNDETSSAFYFLDTVFFLEILYSPDPNEFHVLKESTFLSAGTLTQSMIVEPEMIPQGIIIVTDPLPEGTSVKVYHSSNGGDTFSSALINHNIENATSAKYFFPAGTKIDLSMIKLELLSTSGGSPIVHYIDYFYTPSGVSTL